MSHTRSNLSQTVISSWLAVGVTSVCQLISIPIALAALTKADFALYAIISQILTAVMLVEFGISSASARLLIDARTEGGIHYQRMWMASAIIFTVQACIIMALVIILTPFIGSLFHLEPSEISQARWIFLSVGAIKAISYALGINATSLFAGQQLRLCNLVSVFGSILDLMAFIFAIRSGFGLWAYPIAMLVSSLFGQVFTYYLAKKHDLVGSLSWKFVRREEVRKVYHLGFDVFVAGVFNMVMGNSLLIFSGHLLTMNATAMLAVNLKIVTLMLNILQRIPGSAGPLLMKMVSEDKLIQFRLWFVFLTKVTLGTALLAAGFFVIGNKWIITLWTSADMVLSFPTAILLSLNAYRFLVNWQFVTTLAIFKEIRKVKAFLLWEVILYIGLAYTLGTKFGMNGLLAANLLSAAAGALPGGMWWMSFYSGLSMGFQLRLLLQSSAPLIFAFIAFTWLGRSFWEISWGMCLIVGAIWCLVAALVGYLLILNKYERSELGKIFEAVSNKLFPATRVSH